MTITPHLDILVRETNGSFVWLEATNNIDAAKARLQELCAANPGEYFVFDQRTQKVVMSMSTRAVGK